jgi:transcriptional regulator with XRE-family HTH domain
MALTTRTTADPMTGLDLRIARLRAGISQKELARRLGVYPQRVSEAEQRLRVAPKFVDRYLAALEAPE